MFGVPIKDMPGEVRRRAKASARRGAVKAKRKKRR
jgi:hypothetical protein